MVKVGNALSKADELAGNAEVLRCQGDLDKAAEEARKGLKDFPDSAELHLVLGRVLLGRTDYDGALKEFDRARTLAPGDDRPDAWRIATFSRRCDFPSALAAGKEARSRFRDSVRVKIAVARTYLDSSQPDKALSILDEAVRSSPMDRDAILWRAECYARLSDWDKALDEARDAVSDAERGEEPQNAVQRHSQAKPYRDYGRILVQRQKYEEALGYLEQAKSIDREDPEPWAWCSSGWSPFRRCCQLVRVEGRHAGKQDWS